MYILKKNDLLYFSCEYLFTFHSVCDCDRTWLITILLGFFFYINFLFFVLSVPQCKCIVYINKNNHYGS